MDYSLAKELKDAGFPQNGGWYTREIGDFLQMNETTPKDNNWVFCPILSELIEACGEGIELLRNDIHEWKAYGSRGEFAKGSTPEEAVTRLWLALNKET